MEERVNLIKCLMAGFSNVRLKPVRARFPLKRKKKKKRNYPGKREENKGKKNFSTASPYFFIGVFFFPCDGLRFHINYYPRFLFPPSFLSPL